VYIDMSNEYLFLIENVIDFLFLETGKTFVLNINR
jgi:hypothetical protein